MRGAAALALAFVLGAGSVAAQGLGAAEARALEARVATLSAEIAEIRARLRAAGVAETRSDGIGGEVLVRLDRMEVELSRLTGAIEELGFRQRRIAEDGARRIGGLDLRLTELEGGDIAALAPEPPLGQSRGAAPAEEPAPQTQATPDAEPAATGTAGGDDAPEAPPDRDPMLALAIADIQQGRFDQGEERLARYLADAPEAADAARAHFWLGQSRFTRGQYGPAARSFLNAYNSAQDGPQAAESLLQLGITLGRLGQTREACLTLREVRMRFPDGGRALLDAADAEADALACRS